jgi:hypothetical protein
MFIFSTSKMQNDVQVLGVAHLELHNIFASLDFFYRGSTLPSCTKEEVLDLMDLLRLQQQVEYDLRMAHTINHLDSREHVRENRYQLRKHACVNMRENSNKLLPPSQKE